MLQRGIWFALALGAVLTSGAGVVFAADPGGYDAARIENEYMLVVPEGKAEEVWAYLNERFQSRGAFLGELGPSFSTQFSVEKFSDLYFDDPGLQILRSQSGVRHRTRNVLSDSSSRKNGRELIQLKLNRDGDRNQLNRTEMKFPVAREGLRSKSPWAAHPLIGRIEEKYQHDFMERVRDRGIEPLALQKTLTIRQARRRAYLAYKGKPFITLTIDEAAASFWWKTAKLNHLELELNEIAYTVATPQERQFMEGVNERLRRDLLNRFPDLKQDQAPKYNKMVDRLSQEFIAFPMALRFGVPLELVAGGLASAFFLGLASWLVRFRRLRRERQRAEIRLLPPVSE